jgi:polyphosphate kinase
MSHVYVNYCDVVSTEASIDVNGNVVTIDVEVEVDEEVDADLVELMEEQLDWSEVIETVDAVHKNATEAAELIECLTQSLLISEGTEAAYNLISRLITLLPEDKA